MGRAMPGRRHEAAGVVVKAGEEKWARAGVCGCRVPMRLRRTDGEYCARCEARLPAAAAEEIPSAKGPPSMPLVEPDDEPETLAEMKKKLDELRTAAVELEQRIKECAARQAQEAAAVLAEFGGKPPRRPRIDSGRILAVLVGTMSTIDVATAVGLARPLVQTTLSRLTATGKVRKVGRAMWRAA
jgi:hypothetical protein